MRRALEGAALECPVLSGRTEITTREGADKTCTSSSEEAVHRVLKSAKASSRLKLLLSLTQFEARGNDNRYSPELCPSPADDTGSAASNGASHESFVWYRMLPNSTVSPAQHQKKASLAEHAG